ncbi:MAG: thioredoxin [Ignavibacteriae bacterium]|jgi:thioredoxin 1|nr:MAG: thioredoxin [Ignavibacteriota bacterium]
MVSEAQTANHQPQTFDEFIAQSDRPVLVDFWAEWCGPCHMVAPTIKEIAQEFAGKAYVLKVNVDTKPHVAAKFGIQSIPTLIIFNDGKPVWRVAGVQPYSVIKDQLEKFVHA